MLPQAFLERMQRMLGSEYEAFLASYEQERYQALRMNPLKRDARGRSAADEGDRMIGSDRMARVPWEENGYYFDKEKQPGRHPFHEAGLYYIQEPSAMAPVPLLEIRPGDKVLDLCAAPGGKSTQIAAALQGKGLLWSNEIHPARAKILSENIERLGVCNACVSNEMPERLSEKFPGYFDRVLVDAPCSGEGMFRKDEAACEEWSPENVEMCAARQDGILDHAAKMLRPGGRLVYSTCTFAPQENEGSIRRFLERHPEFTLIPIDKEKMGLPVGVCDGRPEWAFYPAGKHSAEGAPAEAGRCPTDLTYTLRLWPQHIRGEGHFAAVLQKGGTVPEGYKAIASGGTEPELPPGDPARNAWRGFERSELDRAACGGRFAAAGDGAGTRAAKGEGICEQEGTKLLRFGDNLYEAPACLPALKGLKVLRPGLHLGTLKKDRLEPSHALALALSASEARHVCHISAKERVVGAYLNGQTFPMEGEKGWYLICVDGFSVGWGKLTGGVMKNHYPKGLRRV